MKKQNRIIVFMSAVIMILLIIIAFLITRNRVLVNQSKSSISTSSVTHNETSNVPDSDLGDSFEASNSVRPSTGADSGVTEVVSEDPSDNQEHPKAPRLDYIEDLLVRPYSGEPYIMLNNGLPFFDTLELKPESYEIYYDLDELGRCTLADAVVGKDLMPTEKRGNISSIKPTGWQSSKYPQELVDGESLYNRCHLIAFGLCGENANPYNLITGTRYMNTKGVNDFENLVIDYIRETDNHVRYRVTPVFTGDNLICDGQIIEAWSIEDEGEGICFNIYAYNVQPGIYIDYSNGDNRLDGEESTTSHTSSSASVNPNLLAKDYCADFVLNIKSKKIHSPDCENILAMSPKNRQDYYGSYNELIRQGYLPDKTCIFASGTG